jgi:transcriptional regulator with XRE-family HTH domain
MRMEVVRDPDELPGAIRTAMKARGVSQTQLARDLGYSAKHVNQMLQGNAGISIEMLFRIMRYLGVAVVFAP